VPYTHVLLDLDHTLLDTEVSLEMAFAHALRSVGLEVADHYGVFTEINNALWRQVELQQIEAARVNLTRFTEFVARLELDVEPQTLATEFAVGMGQHGDLYPGARELLDDLAQVATLAMVTNGVSEIQRARIERLELGQYFDAITISGEVGCAKPGAEIFERTFQALGAPDQTQALMVGDSLASDMLGGITAGIDTCWYNPAGKVAPADVQPTHVVGSLREVVALVR